MKEDECALLLALVQDPSDHPWAPDHAERLGINEKRADYLYEKWTRHGLWEYGVSARSGWLTDKGRQRAEELT